MKTLLAMGLLLCAATVAAKEPLVFRASAKVSVSASGEVTGVEPDASLSPALRKLVRDEVLGYRFEPPMREGKAVEGTTYVSLGGCAVPDGEDYRVSLAFKGVGPRLAGGQFVPPEYPEKAWSTGVQLQAVVSYVVQPDGTAMLDDIRYEEKKSRSKRLFDKPLKQWVRNFRYDPEILAGEPVATKLRVPVEFALYDDDDPRSPEERARQHRLSTPECTAAASRSEHEPVAVDSPFKRLPSG